MNGKQLAAIAKSNNLATKGIYEGSMNEAHCAAPGRWDIYLSSEGGSDTYTVAVQLNYPKTLDGWDAERAAASELVGRLSPQPIATTIE